MTSTYSPNRSYELQATGDNVGTWGVILDNQLSIIDLNFGGRLSVDCAGSSDVTITDAQARNWHQTLTGTLTGNISFIVPNAGGSYYIYNNTSGAYSVTVKPSGGTGIVIPQGKRMLLFANPTTGAMEEMISYSASMTINSLTLSSPIGIASGGTGQATQAAGFDALSPTTTRGDLIARGASSNGRVAIGAANTLLSTDGTDPAWRTVSDALDAAISSTQGIILYRGASAWAALGTGTSGYFLQTQGVGANPQWAPIAPVAAFTEVVSALVDGATPALDASLGNIFTLTSTTNPTIAVPSNPTSGQKIVIRFVASGGSRTLALNTGAGGFRFGTDITALSATTSGKTDYIGCIYNSSASYWDVVAYSKGY